jgi:hypothetical protein
MNLDYLRRFAVNQSLFAPPDEKHRLPLCPIDGYVALPLRADHRKFTFHVLRRAATILSRSRLLGNHASGLWTYNANTHGQTGSYVPLCNGLAVNHKRVLRLLREDNLLCVRRRKFLLGTTDSRHGLPIYPNVAAGMVLTSIDQLWVAEPCVLSLVDYSRAAAAQFLDDTVVRDGLANH